LDIFSALNIQSPIISPLSLRTPNNILSDLWRDNLFFAFCMGTAYFVRKPPKMLAVKTIIDNPSLMEAHPAVHALLQVMMAVLADSLLDRGRKAELEFHHDAPNLFHDVMRSVCLAFGKTAFCFLKKGHRFRESGFSLPLLSFGVDGFRQFHGS